MRYGCCGNLVTRGPDATGIEILEKIAHYGYDYIELPLAEMTALPTEEFAVLKKRLNAAVIRCEASNNFFPSELRLTGNQVNDRELEVYVHKALGRACELGVKVVVFGSGAAKTVPAGFSKEKAFEQIVKLSRKIDAAAAKAGIMIAIEPLRAQECNIINTFEEGCGLAKAVNGKNVKVLIDFYHMTWERESPQVLLKNKDWLAHVHFSCPYLPGLGERVYPAEAEEWNYRGFVDVLKEIDYQGRVSIEAFANNFEFQAPKALKFLQKNFGPHY